MPRQCLAELDDAEADASVDLAQRCPELARWLREQGYADALQPPLEQIDEAGRARAALRLIVHDEPPAPAAPVDRQALDRIVGDIRRSEPGDEAEPTWWSRLREWLRDQLPETGWDTPAWLEDLGRALGWVGHVVYWLGVLLILAALGSLVWALVRLLQRHAPSSPHGPGAGTRPGGDDAGPPRGLDSIHALQPAEQARALLRYTIAALRDAGALPRSPGRTDAELAAALRDREIGGVQRFRRIAACAERCIYGGREPDTGELGRCFADARELTERRGAAA